MHNKIEKRKTKQQRKSKQKPLMLSQFIFNFFTMGLTNCILEIKVLFFRFFHHFFKTKKWDKSIAIVFSLRFVFLKLFLLFYFDWQINKVIPPA